MFKYPVAFGLAALTGCASQPTIITETIHVPTYIQVPQDLTKDCTVDLGQNPTWGSALIDYSAALKACQGQITAIRGLTPPSQTPPINP